MSSYPVAFYAKDGTLVSRGRGEDGCSLAWPYGSAYAMAVLSQGPGLYAIRRSDRA